jgi:hypothetical protein
VSVPNQTLGWLDVQVLVRQDDAEPFVDAVAKGRIAGLDLTPWIRHPPLSVDRLRLQDLEASCRRRNYKLLYHDCKCQAIETKMECPHEAIFSVTMSAVGKQESVVLDAWEACHLAECLIRTQFRTGGSAHQLYRHSLARERIATVTIHLGFPAGA